MARIKKTLFVIGQHGALNYIYPLLKIFLKKYGPDRFSLCVPSYLSRDVEQKLPSLTEKLNWSECRPKGLESLRREWFFENVFVSSTYQEEEKNTILYAKSNRIKSYQLIDMTYDLKKRIVGTNGLDVYPDAILLVDKETKTQAVKEGLDKSLLNVIGHPEWESTIIDTDKNIRNALFISQPIEKDIGKILGYTEKDVFELVYSVFKTKNIIEKLIWAKHPRQSLPEYVSKKKDIVIIEDTDVGLKNAGTVIGLYSSFLVKAALAGKNVIKIKLSNTEYEHLSIARMDYIKTATNLNELVKIFDYQNNDIRKYRQELEGSLDRLESLLSK